MFRKAYCRWSAIIALFAVYMCSFHKFGFVSSFVLRLYTISLWCVLFKFPRKMFCRSAQFRYASLIMPDDFLYQEMLHKKKSQSWDLTFMIVIVPLSGEPFLLFYSSYIQLSRPGTIFTFMLFSFPLMDMKNPRLMIRMHHGEHTVAMFHDY